MVTKPSVKAHNIFLFTSEEAGYLHMNGITGTLLNLSGVPKNNYRLEEMIITRENNEVCTVRSLDLANYLCNHGHKMKKVIDSDKNPRFKVFLFEDSKAIQDCIATYLSQKEV